MLFRRSIEQSGILSGWCDCHSHILPGVDDGIQTTGDSLAVLEQYDRLGVKDVWLTPHIMEDIPNRTAVLRERFSQLQQQWKGGVTLHLAAENMIDSLFQKRLEEEDLLLYGSNQDMVLVETSYVQAPMEFKEMLHSVMAKGLYVMLAHPERYMYMDDDYYKDLKDKGVRFQLNLLSLTGAYGPRPEFVARHLLEEGYYDCAGSDLHNLAAFDAHIRQKVIRKSTIEKLTHLIEEHNQI